MNAAYADVLFTAPLPAIFPTNNVHCSVVNISGRARVVTIEALNAAGDRVAALDQWILEPKSIAVIEARGNVAPQYCKFAVEGDGKHFRAGIAVLQQDVGYIAALPAYPVERTD